MSSLTPPALAPSAAPPSAKRPRLATLASLSALQIHVEPAGSSGVHEMFADGSYLPAEEGRFRQVSKGASSFVSRALLGRADEADGEAETAAAAAAAAAPGVAADSKPPSEWVGKVIDGIDGALAELGKAVAVIEALRGGAAGGGPDGGGDLDGGTGGGALLELERYGGRTEVTGAAQTGGAAKTGGVGLMGKRRALEASARHVDERVQGLRAWCDADRAYGRGVIAVRAMCGGLRRVAGLPMVDVGEGDFVGIERVPEGGREDESDGSVRVQTPGTVGLSFCVVGVGEGVPVARYELGEGDLLGRAMGCGGGVRGVVRSVRLARMAAFRELIFSRLAREAAGGDRTVELTSNHVGFECGPGHVVCVRRTVKVVEAVEAVAGDVSSLLMLVAAHACLQISVHGGRADDAGRILDSIERVAVGRCTQRALERALDEAAAFLRVRVDWSRGRSGRCEAMARVWACDVDGDGPSRLLATFEPLSEGNNGEERRWNGHVRVTPAFGVVIAAPDDPTSRSRAGAHGVHVQSGPSQPHTVSGLDDVPRAYVCPVGSGEIGSVLTLLLCVRLLDALEAAARSAEAEVLDVDRQCFSVIVLAPKTSHRARAKVWPRGPGPGREAPSVTAWLNDVRVEDFPESENERVAAWRKLLREMALPSPPAGGSGPVADVGTDPPPVSEDGAADAGAESALVAVHSNGNGWAPASAEETAPPGAE
jgi:hypothetical protein